MKNWEALLKGAKMRPQAFTQMFDGRGSCAIGALYEGLGNKLDMMHCADAWGIVHELDYNFPKTKCPQCHVGFGLGTAVWHLNDSHQWSRENIAHFIKQVEDPTAIENKDLILS